MSPQPNDQQPNDHRFLAVSKPTLLGLGALLLWTTLAALTALAGPIPPFQLAAMTFAIGSIVGLLWTWAKGQSLVSLLAQPPASLALGLYGLLLFHVCYFAALQRAPVVEASLIIYLWPLLIVLFSGLLPAHVGGGRIGWRGIAGASLGLAGTALILVSGERGLTFDGSLLGYLLAGAAAFIWASYSVASRLLRAVPTTAVTANCALTAAGTLALHLALERTIWPATPAAWAAIVALGIGPVGLAFYLWDEGMKAGNIRLLGTLAYATPLVSTMILAGLGLGHAPARIWLAALFIAAGALLAKNDDGRELGAARGQS